jgi:molybdenum-dependent DNA-binding transcriptional regulator ModE
LIDAGGASLKETAERLIQEAIELTKIFGKIQESEKKEVHL